MLPATIVAVECAGRWFYGVQYHPEDDVDEMWHGSYDVPRCPTICSANGNGNGDGNGFNRPSMPNPVTSAVTVAAQLGRRFPVPRFNLSCNAIFEWNLVENAYHESKNLKKEMKTMEASLLRSAKKTQLSYEKTDILTTLFHLLFISFLLY
ncbi:hypothetical protein Tco_0795449 [Tanacetum coccineum]